MTAKEFQYTLRQFTKRQPFKPFLIELFSGNRVLVSHPEAVSTNASMVLFVSPEGRFRVFACSSVCQFLDQEP